jgi:MFS family permease
LHQAASTSRDVIDGRYAWTRLALSVFIGTVGSVGMWAIVVVLPAVQADFGIERAQASLPYAAMMVGFAVGNVMIGRYVDRFGVAVPVAAAAILGLAFLLSAVSSSIWMFAIAQALVGFGSSATFGPMVADVSHWFERRRGIAITTMASGNYLAGVIWPGIITMLLPMGGWRGAFIVVGTICIVAMVPLSLLFLRQRAPHAQEPVAFEDVVDAPSRVRSAGLSPRALQALLSIAGVGCCVAMSMPQVQLVAYCVDLGYGATNGAQMLSLMLFGGIFSRLASGLVADRIGGVRTLLIGSALQGISLILYIPFDGLASLYVVSLIFGLSQGGIVPCYAIIVREYLPAREAGQRVGIVIMATIAGMALGGWLSGWIYDQTGSYEAAFLNGIGWNLLNISVMSFILLRTRRVVRPAMG